MRFYSFTNALYMSQLQLGLQTAHCIAEVAVNAHHFRSSGMFGQWARDHKTIIILDGGNCESLNRIAEFFGSPDNPYVWSHFCEDEASLNGAITSVGIILPEEVYETAALVRSRVLFVPAEIKNSPLANYTVAWTGDAEVDLRRGRLCRFYNEASEWTVELISLMNSCRLA